MSNQRPRRPSEDNVIYANFGARKRVATAAETGGPQTVSPTVSKSQAAMRVLNAAVRRTDIGRAKRGHQYAQQGHVTDLRVRPGGMEASVVGSQNEPFYTGFTLPLRTPQELRLAMSEMARSASASKRARAGEFPDSVLDVLLAATPEEFKFFCDCPDNADVCKHAVALAEEAAKQIDADPGTVFAIRSLSMAVFEDSVRDSAQITAKENASAGSEYFWSGRELPALPTPKIAPMIDDSDSDLLRHAMETVSFTNIDLLHAVSDIEDLYDMLVEE